MKASTPPFIVLKPKPGTNADRTIVKDSGVVGIGSIEGTPPGYLVSYEGNLYGAVNLNKWEERVMHAADRLATGYPTVARGEFPQSDFEVVGQIEKRPWKDSPEAALWRKVPKYVHQPKHPETCWVIVATDGKETWL